MSPRPILFAVAAMAVALGTTAATVSPALAAEAGVEVHYRDLNLNSAAGRAVLERRLERAARIVCGTAFINELDIAAEVNACRTATIAEARGQLPSAGESYAALRVVRAAN
jgi:UrcA family protein